LENLKERNNMGDIDVEGNKILEYILRKEGGKVWNGYLWIRIGTSGGLFCIRQ